MKKKLYFLDCDNEKSNLIILFYESKKSARTSIDSLKQILWEEGIPKSTNNDRIHIYDNYIVIISNENPTQIRKSEEVFMHKMKALIMP